MLLHQFPDLQWLKTQAASQFADKTGIGGIKLKHAGWPSVILNTKTRNTFRPDITGPLSIFTNRSGSSQVSAGNRKVTVTPDTYFISNAYQPYTLEINEKIETETFNIHFGQHFAESALSGVFSTADEMLDNHAPGRLGFGFHNRLIPATPEFLKILDEISLSGHDGAFLDEKLYQLLSMLVQEQQQIHRIQEGFSAVKSSTRNEILKRLLHATDFLYSHYTENPSLDEIASISCLSKFHFLRLFKIAYGKTPHQFITQLKINRAKEMLKYSSSDVKTISHTLGFDSTSSFSRSFRKASGVYPMAYRNQA